MERNNPDRPILARTVPHMTTEESSRLMVGCRVMWPVAATHPYTGAFRNTVGSVVERGWSHTHDAPNCRVLSDDRRYAAYFILGKQYRDFIRDLTLLSYPCPT